MSLLLFWADDLTGNATLKTGKWYHLTVTWDASSKARIIYLNGVVDASDTSTGSLNADSNPPFYIAQWLGGNYLSGSIDDVRIYNRVLTAKEITQLYSLGR